MRKYLRFIPSREYLFVAFLTLLVISIGLISINITELRDPRPRAATEVATNQPGTVLHSGALGGISWSNLANAKTSNDSYATITAPTQGKTNLSLVIQTTNYGFLIPTGSTITKVEAIIERKANLPIGEFALDEAVYLVKGSSVVVQNKCGNTCGSIPTSDTPITVDLGVQTLSTINSLGFGVGYRVQISYNSSQTAVSLDVVSIRVSYTPPPPPDTTNPTIPGNLRVTSKTTSSISLSWNGSTDSGGSGLVGYKIYRGGSYIWSTTSTSFKNVELLPGTSYNFYVRAYDNAGNHSGNSNTVTTATSNQISDSDPESDPSPNEGGGPLQPPPGEGLPSLPSSPIGNEIDPDIVNFLKINLSVPYLLGNLKSPLIVGGFAQDLELKPGQTNYEVDVRGAKFPLGKDLKIQIGGNKALIKKLKINTKATKQVVKFGNLYLGDIYRDNKIDHKDIDSYLLGIVGQDKSSDVNADGVVNSLDWAILLTHLGKVGSR